MSSRSRRIYSATPSDERGFIPSHKRNEVKRKMTVLKDKIHEPVLLSETQHVLKPRPGESYLDLTAGYGGHALAVLNITNNFADSVLVDRDKDAQQYLEKVFTSKKPQLIHSDFLSASRELLQEHRRFDIILADLGTSSLHLDKASRGFAISLEGPLDMRMDQTQTLTAEALVNESSEEDLAEILRRYGEEPKAKQIARAIVNARPLHTTNALAKVVAKVWPGRSRHHPATRTFQALRIAVNDELGQVERAIGIWLELLNPGGRLGVISFHSLEDRIVKQEFNDQAGERYDSDFRLLTRRPIMATDLEIVSNPRSRSAKLRAVAKIKTREG